MPVKIHGKEYWTVAERLQQMIEKTDGKYSLETTLVSWTDGVVIMKATLTIDDQKYTGHAYENEGSGQINKTSALENAETSAIGRCLASAGYAGTEFASADEVVNAIHQQNKEYKEDEIPFGKHKGKKWSEVPDGYLAWVCDNNQQYAEVAAEALRQKKESVDRDKMDLISAIENAYQFSQPTVMEAFQKFNCKYSERNRLKTETLNKIYQQIRDWS